MRMHAGILQQNIIVKVKYTPEFCSDHTQGPGVFCSLEHKHTPTPIPTHTNTKPHTHTQITHIPVKISGWFVEGNDPAALGKCLCQSQPDDQRSQHLQVQRSGFQANKPMYRITISIKPTPSKQATVFSSPKWKSFISSQYLPIGQKFPTTRTAFIDG